MKLVSYLVGGQSSWGIWCDDGIIDLGLANNTPYPTLKAALPDLRNIADFADGSATHEHAAVTLLPPIPNPGRILCVGLNYKSHIAETGREPPTHPMLFPRYADTIVASGQPLIRPIASQNFDFEGELAFVIGRGGRHVAAAQALDHVAGFACFNDGSIRDWQRHTTQFLPGKNFWRSGSFGPWLVTPDETGPIGELELQTRLNGETMQRATLDDLLFGVPELIAYLSTIMPLQPGDVVATGTTGGVGLFRTPPLWMKPGDIVEVEIDRLGTLVNTIEDESSL
ncbi:fumarylacetoacetate hydrolase family protein [Sphingomonas sp. AR_OL41]|uniref:fumarylacetoacetate hydrolase family protein n=1 Tax=Sphingomonas sp. AR_OL41 TaxID=3042729 RepID=UPI00248076F8|nr:fumarylacetoacetate hydrolase family protein [Sphingomonas sp. AR_OL41]MDH7972120.1 fumarylacetoacetate hydrolase family protein [Sphingomonas sp. AR_OL41]